MSKWVAQYLKLKRDACECVANEPHIHMRGHRLYAQTHNKKENHTKYQKYVL